MKFRLAVLSMLLLVGSVFAQTVSPASASVTFDKSTQTTVALPSVTLTAPGNSNYWYVISVPAQFSNVIVTTPGLGLITAGNNATVNFTAGAGLNALDVGSYVVPISFIPLYPSLTDPALNNVVYTITINVTNSRTYVLPGANDRLISHLAAGDVWKTRIRMVNTTGSASISEVRFYDDNGRSTNYLVNGFSTSFVPAVTVPAHGVVDLIVDAAGLKTGTATVHTVLGSIPGINVSYIGSNPHFESAVEVKPSNASSFSVAFENNSARRRSTGVAISNALNYEQTVTLEFLDSEGNSLVPQGTANPRVTIPAGGHYIFTMDTTYDFIKNKSGVLRVTGSQPTLTGFGLVFDLNAGSFYTEPAFVN
jgi:hypothetical protein